MAWFRGKKDAPAPVESKDGRSALDDGDDGDIIRQEQALPPAEQVMNRLITLWLTTPARPASARIIFPVQWHSSDGTALRFNAIVAGWDEFDGIGAFDWHPADGQTWSWLERP